MALDAEDWDTKGALQHHTTTMTTTTTTTIMTTHNGDDDNNNNDDNNGNDDGEMNPQMITALPAKVEHALSVLQ